MAKKGKKHGPVIQSKDIAARSQLERQKFEIKMVRKSDKQFLKSEPDTGMRYLYLNLVIALVIRVGFIAYGTWQDANMKVKFTDIDYKVFTDAAQFVTEGESPFNRATYRYTPLIAWLLTPNIWFHVLFGKCVFVCMDLVAGYLLYKICRSVGYSATTSLFCCQVALYNPLPLGVSSRGNAESIMTVLTLATIFCLNSTRWLHLALASLFYGLSVHVKIYPVIYALPIYLYLGENYTGKPAFKLLGLDILPNRQRIVFILISLSICVSLIGLCYYLYGYEFLFETYIYHIIRKDIKHNFSPYFYLLYLLRDSDAVQPYIGLVTFIPQALFVIAFGFKFHSDLPFCFFMQTFMFVSFNKVCTSQYFLWYLAYLPMLLPRLHVSPIKAVLMTLLWFFGQAAWLMPAYYLEFQGQNTFFEIWLASMGFLSINVWIGWEILSNYCYRGLFKKGKKVMVAERELRSIGAWFGLTEKKKQL